MTVKTYSLARDGGLYVAKNFRVKEFACKDGSDRILIDEELAARLQKIREHFERPVTVNSGYRTAAHNQAVNGSVNSQHLYGKAADIHIAGLEPLILVQYAETLAMGGIGLYGWGAHVDTRSVISRWQQINDTLEAVSGFGVPSVPAPAVITVERKTVYVDGLALQVRAGLLDGENYAHLRDLAAALGRHVNYQAESKKIVISK